MSYQGNNIRGQWKRAFCSATLVGFGGIGGIAGSLVFRTQDSPGYIPGLWACITASLLIIVLVVLLDIYFFFQNKKQAAGSHAIEGADVSCTTAMKAMFNMLICSSGWLPLHLLSSYMLQHAIEVYIVRINDFTILLFLHTVAKAASPYNLKLLAKYS